MKLGREVATIATVLGVHAQALALFAAAIAAGGCIYTEDINERPVPGIQVLTPGPYFLGQTVELDATKSLDEAKGALEARWRAFRCQEDGSAPCEAYGNELVGSQNAVYQVPLGGDHRSIIVELRVSDQLGASRVEPDIYTIDIGNRNPELELQVQGEQEGAADAFVLSRPITLAVRSSDPDEDEVELEWELLPATGSDSARRIFEELDSDLYRLVPDVEGQWEVKVHARDAYGGETTASQVIQVAADAPPCIGVTEPTAIDEAFYILDQSEGPRRLSVLTVEDDLDPFPAADDEGEARFRWLIKEPGESSFAALGGALDNSVLVDPAHYQPGERIEIRVEVQDRVDGPARVLNCSEDDFSCELVAGSGCEQRQSWGVEIR